MSFVYDLVARPSESLESAAESLPRVVDSFEDTVESLQGEVGGQIVEPVRESGEFSKYMYCVFVSNPILR